MKKWQELENRINQKLDRTLSDATDLISGKTPNQFRSWQKNISTKIDGLLSKSKESVCAIPLSMAKKIQHKRDQTVENIISARIELNEKIEQENRLAIITIFIVLLQWTLVPLYKKFLVLLQTSKPTTMAAMIITTTATGLIGIGIYSSGDKIMQATGIVERAPAAIKKEARPKYYKRNERELLITNVVVPSYIEGVTALKKLQVDLSIISSNRYIREYFYDNAHLVEDIFNSRIEPMVPGFPLENEGKQVLKEKITEELNALLKRMKIEGKIEAVYISSILAG